MKCRPPDPMPSGFAVYPIHGLGDGARFMQPDMTIVIASVEDYDHDDEGPYGAGIFLHVSFSSPVYIFNPKGVRELLARYGWTEPRREIVSTRGVLPGRAHVLHTWQRLS